MNQKNKLQFRFDFPAILSLAEKGLNLLDGGLKEEDLRKPSTFATLVWAGLLHADPTLDEKAAIEVVRGINFPDVSAALTEALQRDLATDDEAKPVNSSPTS